MIHQYKSNGYNIVMDVNSGAVHVVDDVTYDAIELFEDISSSEIVDKLKDKYNESDILEAIDEIEELKKMDNCLPKTYISRLLKSLRRTVRPWLRLCACI